MSFLYLCQLDVIYDNTVSGWWRGSRKPVAGAIQGIVLLSLSFCYSKILLPRGPSLFSNFNRTDGEDPIFMGIQCAYTVNLGSPTGVMIFNDRIMLVAIIDYAFCGSYKLFRRT